MHKYTFPDKSFVLHGVRPPTGAPGHVSAWYTPAGELTDLEYIDVACRARPVVKNGPFWQKIAAYGSRFKDAAK